MSVTIGSVDIGIKNFAQCVEKVDLNKILELEKKYSLLPKKIQGRIIGLNDPRVDEILNDVFMSGEIIDCGVYDLSVSDEPDPPYEVEGRKALFEHLEKYKELWSKCDIIIIEQQFFSTFTPGGGFKKSKGKNSEANIKAIKIAENVMSWFLIRFPFKEVMFFGSMYKTQVLGAPKDLTKPQRKKWSIVKATEILEMRGDIYTLDKMKRSKKINKQKQDDVCDTIIQLQAYKYRCLVGKF